jgi:hypothetical protein
METEITSAAAHERAVITVRLTLLLLIIGVALFLLDGYDVTHRVGQERGDSVERLK